VRVGSVSARGIAALRTILLKMPGAELTVLVHALNEIRLARAVGNDGSVVWGQEVRAHVATDGGLIPGSIDLRGRRLGRRLGICRLRHRCPTRITALGDEVHQQRSCRCDVLGAQRQGSVRTSDRHAGRGLDLAARSRKNHRARLLVEPNRSKLWPWRALHLEASSEHVLLRSLCLGERCGQLCDERADHQVWLELLHCLARAIRVGHCREAEAILDAVPREDGALITADAQDLAALRGERAEEHSGRVVLREDCDARCHG